MPTACCLPAVGLGRRWFLRIKNRLFPTYFGQRIIKNCKELIHIHVHGSWFPLLWIKSALLRRLPGDPSLMREGERARLRGWRKPPPTEELCWGEFWRKPHEDDPETRQTDRQMARHWCRRSFEDDVPIGAQRADEKIERIRDLSSFLSDCYLGRCPFPFTLHFIRFTIQLWWAHSATFL